MDYKRFGRLNSKKIEELKNDSKPYDMGNFFPYLTTRSKNMDQRHTISSFKTMIKKYRYAYSLYDNCKALIKRKGLEYETECIEIDNQVYVFTNIPPYDLDHIDCELLYDAEELMPVKSGKSGFIYTVSSILQNMKDRKLSPKQYELLKEYLSQKDFVSLTSEYIKTNELEEAVFNEFVWRMALFGKGIYKESEIKEVYVKRKRARVQDAHSLFSGYYQYDSLDYIHSFTEKLDDAMQYNQTTTANKLFYEFLQENDNTFLLDEFTGNQLLSDTKLIYEDKMTYLRSLKENYAFLLNPYSKEYRHFFGKRKKLYSHSLFNAQQIMRKLKSEYHSIDDMLISLEMEYDKIGNSVTILHEAIENYENDLGENGLPNQGAGFTGDGWIEDDGTGGLMEELREEASVRLILEEMEREAYISMIAGDDIDYYNHLVKEIGLMKQKQYKKPSPQAEYEIFKKNKIDALVKENQPLALFKFDSEKYFEYYDSISIKDAATVCDWVLFEGVSLEGEFFNYKEMFDWACENTIPM